MEDRVGQERKLIIENNTTQNNRQLSFIDQLIKDKQSLGANLIRSLHYTLVNSYFINSKAEQLTLLAKKVESDEKKRKQKQDEMQEKHNRKLQNQVPFLYSLLSRNK